MLNRDEGLRLLNKYLKNKNLVKHSFAVEAILGAMARELGEPEDLWMMTGLLHDLDYQFTKDEPQKHATMAAELLEGMLPSEAIDAIKAHNYKHTLQVPETLLDKSLIAADAVSGLIIATALIIPSKKLQDVQLPTLINKYRDNSFARGCDRKRIALCEDTDMSIEHFLELSLKALQSVADELGL